MHALYNPIGHTPIESMLMSGDTNAPCTVSPHLYRQNHLRRGSLLRLQRDLEVEYVVDDVLQDLHLAHRLVLRDAGHQLLQPGVAVVHIVQGAHRLLQTRVFIPADDQTLLRDATHGLIAAPRRADGTDGFHGGKENTRSEQRRWILDLAVSLVMIRVF